MISEKSENLRKPHATPRKNESTEVGLTAKRYVLGEFVLEPRRRELRLGDKVVHLTRKPFQVFLHLVEHRDRLVSRSELLDLFWEGHDVYDDTLTKCIGAIRKALDDQSENPRFIETHWAEGYRFIGLVEEEALHSTFDNENSPTVKVASDDSTAEEAPNIVSDEATAPLQPKSHSLKAVISVTAVSVVVIAAAIVFYVYHRQANASVTSSVPIRSIAVLPLKNLSNDPANEYFSDGMTDSLITALSKVEGLRVTSVSSVSRFKGHEVDPGEIGRQLKVAAVLEGSVRKDGESVRVAIRLVGTEDQRVIWTSEVYNRSLRDIFALQDEIARSVTAGLRVQLGQGDRQLATRATDNIQAYQSYLNGRYQWNKRTEEGLKLAIDYFEQALVKDPNYAQAYAGLADSYVLMGVGDYNLLPPNEAMPKGKAAALKALELDETLAEAHTSLGFINYVYDWDWKQAESHFRRALELNPNYVTAHHWYALFLGVMGRFDESFKQARYALSLDPVSPIINTDLGLIFCYARQPDRGIEQFRKTIELDPSFVVAHWRLARAYVQKGMYLEAKAELEKLIATDGRKPSYISLAGYIDALAGRRADALREASELEALPEGHEPRSSLIAPIYIGLGDNDRALQWLNRSYKERLSMLVGLRVEPMFDSLRGDRRFQDLERRVGFGW